MSLTKFMIVLCTLAISAASHAVRAEDTLKVAIPQRGAWDAGIADLGLRGGIFKKHGLNLEILYVQAGPESIQALCGHFVEFNVSAVGTAPLSYQWLRDGAPIPGETNNVLNLGQVGTANNSHQMSCWVEWRHH